MSRYASSSSAVAGVLDSTVTPELDWELLYDAHADRLRRIIQRRVGPAHTEDVLQDTFVRAIRNCHTLDPDRPIAPWLITIALRAATDAQRSQFRTVHSELVDEPASEEPGFGGVDEELVRRTRLLGIKHALASLNPKQRRMLEEIAVKGTPYEELAAAEKMTTDAVKMAVLRARTNFRKSYNVFTRRDLFGGIVGAALWRLRSRLQRYQSLVGEHATAFGAATLTLAAVGIIAFPAARPIATEASEMKTVIDVVAAEAGEASPAVSVGLLPVADRSNQDEVPQAGRSASETSGRTVDVAVRSEISQNDGMTHTTIATDVQTGTTNTRKYGGVDFDCTETRAGALTCAVLETAPQPPEA